MFGAAGKRENAARWPGKPTFATLATLGPGSVWKIVEDFPAELRA